MGLKTGGRASPALRHLVKEIAFLPLLGFCGAVCPVHGRWGTGLDRLKRQVAHEGAELSKSMSQPGKTRGLPRDSH